MAYLTKHLIEIRDAAEIERQTSGVKALAYYDGAQPSGILKVKEDGIDDNVSTNYAQTIVDKGTSFLFGSDLKIDVGTEGDRLLSEVWPEDSRAVDLVDLATNGGIFGHAWLKIAIAEAVPQIHVLDPLNMSASWDKGDYKQVTRYRNQFNTEDENGTPIIWREDTIRVTGGWQIIESASRPDSRNWQEVRRISWPYPFAPIIECKNLPKPNEFYGKPDLSRNVLAICFYIARVDSLINKIIRAHASPKPFAKGLQKQNLEMGTDGMLFLPDKESEIKLLEMSGDLNGALSFRKQLRESLAEVSHVPEVASGKLEGIGTLSGLALKLLYGPLLDRTVTKRRLYGKLVKDVVRAILTIAGTRPGEIALHWPNPMPADETEMVNNASVKKEIGVSTDTLLSEMGYDPQAERTKRQAEQPRADQQRPEGASAPAGQPTI